MSMANTRSDTKYEENEGVLFPRVHFLLDGETFVDHI